MKTVLVLMSTYNGANYISRQIDSILCQEQVLTSIFVRDDGSTDDTVAVLQSYERKFPSRIDVIYGKNCGWKQSFMQLLYEADLSYDYYCFSDQDDLWMSNKLIDCILLMENASKSGVKLAHCNSICATEKLEPQQEQENRVPIPPNRKIALTTEFFQGCGMIWNELAMKKIRTYRPLNKNLSHDFWVGLICFLTGTIYFCQQPSFYHIRYDENSSTDGNIANGRLNRIKNILDTDHVYMNPAEDLLQGYSDCFTSSERKLLLRMSKAKKSFSNRLALIFDFSFRRPSILSTILFKICILIGKY